MAATTTTTTKFVTEPKTIFPLSVNDLESLSKYSPNAKQPDALLSTIALPAGSHFANISTAIQVPKKKWSTVQISENQHIELNSALVYLNHSCVPTMEIDTTKMEVRVARNRDLQVGDELSFFYPSTEWQMAKPFACLCGSGAKCLGTLSGAADIDVLAMDKEGMFFNDHILKMKKSQQS